MPRASTMNRHLGLDLGGTNIKWVVTELDGDGQVRAVDRGQVPTRPVGGPDAIVPRLASVALEAAEPWPGLASVGIGVPGLYDPVAGTTRFLVNVPGEWAGVPVAPAVGEALGVPAALINDARAFGLAEHRLGAGRGVESLIGLTLGTGVGGVIVVGGRVLFGHDGTAGEIGHQTIEPDGPLCGCGNRGCLEALTRADRIAATCGTASAEEAVDLARAGDPRATAGLAQIGRYLGIGIGNVLTLVSPDLVVIGGGIAAAGDLLFGPIRAELAQRVRTTSLDGIEIVTAELGVWAGAIGAAIHGADAAEASISVEVGVGAGAAR